MEDSFFTSKKAAEITGSTLRQLQYWREKEVVVPTISASGTGRSVYYSLQELLKLAVIQYCLKAGLNFELAATTIKQFENEKFFTGTSFDFDIIQHLDMRYMFSFSEETGKLELGNFDLKKAYSSLKTGKPVIPVCLDDIYQQLAEKID